MRLVFLGTSAGIPTIERGLPSIYLNVSGEHLLLDCGEGTQQALLLIGTNVTKIDIVLISHLHGDHFFGIFGLLQTCTLLQRKKPLLVVCPPLIQNYFSCLMQFTPFHLSFPLTIISPDIDKPIQREKFTIRCIPVRHGVNSYGYVIEEHMRPGQFHPEKARRLNIPQGPLWKQLQDGHHIVINNKKIRPSEVVEPSIPGIKIGYSGDTLLSEAFIKACKTATLIIHDATYLDEKDRPLEKMHATLDEAMKTADLAQCRMLVLTHFSSRYKQVKGYPQNTSNNIPLRYAYDLLELEITKDQKIKEKKRTS